MTALTPEILAGLKPKIETVEIPEWGCIVPLRAMTGRERFDWTKLVAEHDQDGVANMLHLLVRSICDTDGNLTIPEDQIDHLGRQNGVALERLYRAAMRINGIGEEATAEAKKN